MMQWFNSFWCGLSYIEEFWYDHTLISLSPTSERPNTTSYRYESYLQHSDPVVLALNPFFVLEYVDPNTFYLQETWLTSSSEMTQCPHVARNSHEQRPLSSPLSASFMTCAPACLIQTPSAAHHLTWTSTGAYLAPRESRLTTGVRWKLLWTRNTSLYFDVASSVRFPPNLTCPLTIMPMSLSFRLVRCPGRSQSPTSNRA
jgi:hypothetical protein